MPTDHIVAVVAAKGLSMTLGPAPSTLMGRVVPVLTASV